MSLGPLMIDLEGPELQAVEREMLQHPLCGGVILFSRNYATPEQVQALVEDIHALRQPPLLVAVDHEGGAVQRFRNGFTRLPACAAYGKVYHSEPERARELAHSGGWLMAAELRALGLDFSFAPVLDIGNPESRIINDRAFHRDPEAITELARAFISGMRAAGMSAVGKHFPGHGSVVADSHHELPVDERPLVDIEQLDLVPFERLVHAGLPAVMPAHVVYPQVDSRPAGFSPFWLREVLRQRLGFQGCIFSDDISMAGAAVAGGPVERAEAALQAGCDMVLVCNDRSSAEQVIDALGDYHDLESQTRLLRMHGFGKVPGREALMASDDWQHRTATLAALASEPELDLGDDMLA